MRRPYLLVAVCACFAVAACDSNSPIDPLSPGSASFSRTDGTSSVVASAVSPSEIDLTWQSSSNQLSGFEVVRSTTGPTGSFSLIATTAAAVTSYANVGLAESTNYCYEVRSFRTTGRNTTYSAYSEVACAATKAVPVALTPPSGADATPQGSSAVAIGWTLSAGTASGFRVERSASSTGPWEAAATTPATARSYVDAARSTEKAVCYHVIAIYVAGASEASNVDCTTPPAAPTNLAANAAPDAVALTWADNSAVEDGYEVQRAVDGVSFSTLNSLPANSTSYRDVAVTSTKTYSYRVQARKDAGVSDNSNTLNVTVSSPLQLAAPSAVDAVPFPDQYFIDPFNSPVRVSWQDNSSNEDGFRVERASTPSGPWTQVATTPGNTTSLYLSGAREQQVCVHVVAFTTSGASSPSPVDCTTPPANPTNLVAKAADGQSITLTWTDNSAVEDSYKVSRLDGAGSWNDIATLAANTVSYRDVGATVNVTYTYLVQALKDGGTSDYTNEAAAVISTDAPAAPLGAVASYWVLNEYGWFYLDVLWSDGSNNEAGFRIESSADGVSGWQTHAIVAANTTFMEDKLSLWGSLGPQSGCYRVIAFNDAGESSPSNVTCTGWYSPPTNLTATAVDQQSIELTWTDNAHFEQGYVVLRSTTADGLYDVIGETTADATSYRDTGLTSGQEYWYVVATDFGGDSYYDGFESSDQVSATTLSATGAAPSSRRIINKRPALIRVRGQPTPEAIQASHRKPIDRSFPPDPSRLRRNKSHRK